MLILNKVLCASAKILDSIFEGTVDKSTKLNAMHIFQEGNGRSMRIWLDLILKKEIGHVVDWSKIDKEDYLFAMERSPVKDIEIKYL